MVLINLEQADLIAARIAKPTSKGGESMRTPNVILISYKMLSPIKVSILLCDQGQILHN